MACHNAPPNIIYLLVVLTGHFFSGDCSNYTWSSISSTACPSADCTVPAGETWTLDANMDVNTLTVHGTLIWDTSIGGIELRAYGILVEEGGLFQVGTEEDPVMEKATIYIKHPHNPDLASHPSVGQRYLAVYGTGKIQIHGRPMEKTWSELDRDHAAGSTELHLKDDPATMGWRVGDRVGVATTSRGDSTLHIITEIQENLIKLDSPLKAEHWGGFREIEGFSFWMAAEVINLDRSVLITGDHDDFHGTGFGLHTGAFMKDPPYEGDVGVFTSKFATYEHCGQLDVLGRYCIHLHVVRSCPECVLQGNAFFESYQSAVTLHGVHDSLMDNNVGWDNRGVGVYTEDGNEMFNVISNNVFICHDIFYCRIEWQNVLGVGPAQKEGGIFMFGMRNDVIGNHVVGHEHGLWSQGASQNDGRPFGFSMGKVCNQFIPFGKIQGNVFHDCQRFGMYVDFQYPRKVVQDINGFVKKKSCGEFTEDGDDNGVVNYIEDQFDWHNTFVGGYFYGDLSWIRYRSVNNIHHMYWKFGKNMVDPNTYHIVDSIIVNDASDPYGILQVLLPGGPFVFRMKNVTFAGGPVIEGVLNAPQHCGLVEYNEGVPGAKCNVQFLLEDIDFSRVKPNIEGKLSHIHFGASEGNPLSPIFLAGDNSLDGHHAIVSNFLDGFGEVPGCEGPMEKYSGGYACDSSVRVRRIVIWGPDMGDLTLKGPGYNVGANGAFPVLGTNAGLLHYEKDQNHVYSSSKKIGGGYAAHVVLGEQYSLDGLYWMGDIVVEVSDPVLADYFGTSREEEGIQLTLNLQTGGQITCHPNAGESRKFHGADGISKGVTEAGALGDCGQQFRDQLGPPIVPTIPPSGDCGCEGAEYDADCLQGGMGCAACGIPFCRYCGGNGFPDCKFGTSAPPLPSDTTARTTTTTTTVKPPTGPTQPTTSSTASTKTTTKSTTTSKATTTTTTASNPGCDCDGAMYDSRCGGDDPFGGLGCMACGHDHCRFCGHDGLPECEGGGGGTTTAGQGGGGCDCGGAAHDTRCSDPGSDEYGGLGCMACGKENCRFCGHDQFPPCP